MQEKIKINKDGRSAKGEPFCKRGHPKEFGKDCRECNRIRILAWQEKHGDAKKSELRKRYQEDSEYRASINASNRAYQESHRAESVERARAWKLANRDRVNAWGREHYKKIRHEHAIRVRSWKDRNREVWREINNAAKNRRRARLLDSAGTHSRAEWNLILAKQKGRCAMCGMKRKLEKDHIIPLSLGGSDMAINLQGLCRPCNASKSASIAEGAQLGIFDRVAAHLRE